MDWELIKILGAPILTALLAFILNKYYQNKSELIAYYGSISSYNIPNDRGYPVYLLVLDEEQNKSDLDKVFRDKIPMLIKYGEGIWIYGSGKDNTTLRILVKMNIDSRFTMNAGSLLT